MNRVKEIEDKEVAPKLNVEVTKRFVRNALWDAAHNKSATGALAEKSMCHLLIFRTPM